MLIIRNVTNSPSSVCGFEKTFLSLFVYILISSTKITTRLLEINLFISIFLFPPFLDKNIQFVYFRKRSPPFSIVSYEYSGIRNSLWVFVKFQQQFTTRLCTHCTLDINDDHVSLPSCKMPLFDQFQVKFCEISPVWYFLIDPIRSQFEEFYLLSR